MLKRMHIDISEHIQLTIRMIIYFSSSAGYIFVVTILIPTDNVQRNCEDVKYLDEMTTKGVRL